MKASGRFAMNLRESRRPVGIPARPRSMPGGPALAPRVSVVICAYTMERLPHIHEAVDSVLRQTLPPHEVVLAVDHNHELFQKLGAELGERVTPWDIQQVYKIYPNLEEDFKSVARSMGWTPPPPPTAVAPPTPQPEEPSLGDLYLKYYAEALERHRAEAAAEEVRTVSRVEEHEAEVPHEEENEVIKEVPAEVSEEIPSEVHIEEAEEPKEEDTEEPSAADLYLRYYREALARHTAKT